MRTIRPRAEGVSMSSKSKNKANKKTNPTKTTVAYGSDYSTMTETEKKRQTIIGVIVVVIVVLAVAGAAFLVWHGKVTGRNQADDNKTTAYETMNSDKTVRPPYVSKDGAIVYDKNGLVKKPDSIKADGRKVVDVYMDFNCPGCGAVDRVMNPFYMQYLKDGKIILRLHPISILKVSTDDYSTRSANAVFRSLDVAPDATYQYISYLFSDGVQPGEGTDYKPFSDARLRESAVKSGIDKDKASKLTDKKYDDWLKATSTYTANRRELWRSDSPSGGFATPIVTVDGKILNMETPGDVLIGLKTALGEKIPDSAR